VKTDEPINIPAINNWSKFDLRATPYRVCPNSIFLYGVFSCEGDQEHHSYQGDLHMLDSINSALQKKIVVKDDLQSFQSLTNEAKVTRDPNGTTIHAGGGNDKITVNENADHSVTVNVNGEQHHFTEEEAKTLTIDAGDGNDKVVVNGDTGVTINGGRGDDLLMGGEGNDTLNGGEGRDIMAGGAGEDILLGGAGDDRMYGQSGDDIMLGGDGNDAMSGGTGHDRMFGDKGSDHMVGGFGNDLIDGGHGRDALYGNAGDDQLVGTASSRPGTKDIYDIMDGGTGNNTIMDWNHGFQVDPSTVERLIDVIEQVPAESLEENGFLNAIGKGAGVIQDKDDSGSAIKDTVKSVKRVFDKIFG